METLRQQLAALQSENARLRAMAGGTGLSRLDGGFQLPAGETLAAVIEASPLPIVALTAQGHISLWNAAAEKVFGWVAGEVLGQPLPFIPDDKLDEHRSMRAQDLTGAGFCGREIRRRRRDGSAIDLSVSTAPIRNESGDVIGIMSVYVDITQRKSAEEWLHRQAELLEQAYDAVLVWDIDGAIQYWNRAAVELYGYSKEEAVGRVSHNLLRTATLSGEPFLDELRRARRWGAELFHTTHDGRRIIVESRQVVVRTAEGADIVLETNRDITGRVRIERELRAANEALRRTNADLEQFAYAAAHDLQEPLRNIAIFAQLLVRRFGGTLQGDGVEFMNTIVNAARRMQVLVNDLLAYTHSVEGQPADLRTEDANGVLETVLSDLSSLIRETGAVVSADHLPEIPISSTHLSQLFHNLIGNAIKYRRPDVPPRIRIEAGGRGRDLLLSVRDNGEGIAPQYRDRIFGLFKRLHGSDMPGTGLGLAICKRIVEHYDGRIWVEDGDEGAGSTFHILLPLSGRNSSAAGSDSPHILPPSHDK